MNGFERRTEEKKLHILSVAHESFKRLGIEAFNILEIAKEAGVSHVTIYHYFGNKNGFIQAVLDFTLESKSLEAKQTILRNDSSFDTALNALIAFELKRYDGYHTNFIEQLIERERQLMNRTHEAIFDGVKRLFAMGRSEGRIDKDLSDETLVVLIHMFRFLKSNQYLSSPQVVKEVFELFRRGLGGEA
jgi:AcrR family transcriptional regulator